jgi:hypothetical protein
MEVLPNADKAIIPVRKITEYALCFSKAPDKALAFQLALGYNQDNAEKLIKNIIANLTKFPAKTKGDKGYGMLYEVIMTLEGENGRTAKVLTAWMHDISENEMRLITVHVD